MKALQTGDWHLGKTFFEQSLIDDQKFFLKQLTSILQHAYDEHAPYDALIVPGDIYDRAVPPAEAVTLFSKFLNETHASFPDMHLLFLAGNHDSAERLSYAKELLSSSNTHFCTDCSSLATPVMVNGCAVYQLPFLTAGCIDCTDEKGTLFDTPLRSQQELLDAAILRITTERNKAGDALPSILCAHLFAAGGTRSSSEHIPVGTAEEVSGNSFAPFTYTALGHLHSFQKVTTKNNNAVYYSGSPLAYSFDESDSTKYLLSVTVTHDTGSIEKIPVTPLHPCATITASFDELMQRSSFSAYTDSYLQVLCTDNVPVSNPMAQLRKIFPHILSFTYKTTVIDAAQTSLAERKALLGNTSIEGLYEAYINDLYGKEKVAQDPLTPQKQKLFAQICASLQEDKES